MITVQPPEVGLGCRGGLIPTQGAQPQFQAIGLFLRIPQETTRVCVLMGERDLCTRW